MEDYKLEYWIETVQSSFDENNINGIPDNVIKSIAKDMLNSAECQSMAFGQPSAPKENPEITLLKKKYETRIQELENNDRVFRESVAKRRRVLPEDVYIKDGSVMYDTLRSW